MQKIFGIGFSKTGTTSLESALQLLGYNTWRGHWENPNLSYTVTLHLYKDYEILFKIIDCFDAFTDIPWGGSDLCIKLYERLPNSKFILTRRDTENWYASFERMITKFDPNHETALDSFDARERYGAVRFFKDVFDVETLSGNRQKIIDYYNTYNRSVVDFFNQRNANFIVLDITGEGIDGVNYTIFLIDQFIINHFLTRINLQPYHIQMPLFHETGLIRNLTIQ